MKFAQDILNCVEDLRIKTTDSISSIQAGLIPEFVDTNWAVTEYYISYDDRIDDISREKTFLKLNNVKFKVDHGEKDYLVFKENAIDAVRNDRIHPFMLFINGYFIKWSDIEIVRELNYTYFIISNAERFEDNVQDVQYIHIPFNVTYTETRELHHDKTEMFRFDEEGLLQSWGKTIIYANVPDLYYKSYTSHIGGVIDCVDLNFDKHYKLTPTNFISFSNKKLSRDISYHIYNLNVLTVNDGKPLEEELTYKIFYKTTVNENISNIMIPDNDDWLKRILTRVEDKGNIDILTLEKDFNFKYSKDLEYEDNVTNALKYLHLYNSNMVNEVYEKRSRIKTLQFTGEYIKNKIVNYELTMLRWKAEEGYESYVLLFKNGELWYDYSTISYTSNRFTIIAKPDKIADTDTFEFIFFLGVNNSIVETKITRDNNIVQDKPIKTSDLLIYSPHVETQLYNFKHNEMTVYAVDYDIDENNAVTFKNPYYYGKDLVMASKYQFHYVAYVAERKSVYLTLSYEFKACLDPTRYLVFINGRLITKSMYKLLLENVDNTFAEPTIHLRIMLNKGDKVEVVYIPRSIEYTDIGSTNKTDVYKIQAVIDKQPMFTIPYPVGNYLANGNSFFVMLGSLIVDPSRYNVIGNKLIFIDPEDYVELGRELVFVFMYNKASNASDIDYLDEEDHIIIDSSFQQVQYQGQLTFYVEFPFEDFLSKGGDLFVTYRGLYVNPSRYTLQDNAITFKDNSLDLDKDSVVVFTYCYSKNSKTQSKTTPVKVVSEGQTEFNIPLPYEDYFKDGNKFYVTRNGTFLSEDDYIIDQVDNIITLATSEGLELGQELLFHFMYAENVAIKTAAVEVKATEESQRQFEIPFPFSDYREKGNKFFLVIGTTYVDRRRYSIEGNYVILNEDDAMHRGRVLSFFFIYTQDTLYSSSISIDDSAANKYTSIETMVVKATSNGQRTFVVPKAEAIMFDKKFFVNIGSTFMDEDSYTTDHATNTITFKDSVDGLAKGRSVLFTFITNEYAVVEKESHYVEVERDLQEDFIVPIPFDNYFERGNECLVFIGGTYVDKDRYGIDPETNVLSFIERDPAITVGRHLTFVFIYVANHRNESFTRDDVSHTRLPEYGYVYLSKSAIKYSMTKKLYFLFINGKKIDLSTIKDISSNLIRLTKDTQSRYNVCILDYTPKIEEFEPYFRVFSEYDNIINKLNPEELDKLFGIYNIVSDTEVKVRPNISQEAIINNIIRVHYMANGINDGLPFIYNYEKGILKNRAKDSEGNYIFDTMDASKYVNIKYN